MLNIGEAQIVCQFEDLDLAIEKLKTIRELVKEINLIMEKPILEERENLSKKLEELGVLVGADGK